MTTMNRCTLSASLLFLALTLTACATKPKEEAVVESAPVVVEQQAETEPVPVVAEQQVQAPVAMAEQPAPKPVIKKKVVRKPAPAPEVVEPAPVVESVPEPVFVPEPVVEEEPQVIAEPAPVVEEPGFLEKYWLWMLGLIIGLVAVLWVAKQKE